MQGQRDQRDQRDRRDRRDRLDVRVTQSVRGMQDLRGQQDVQDQRGMRGMQSVRGMQGELPFAPVKPRLGHGGAREGAGRKAAKGRRAHVAHVARPATTFRFPVHVTTRVRADVARLRNYELCAVLRRAFVHGCTRDAFRICQFSIQGNHIHMICEAKNAQSLAAGVQAWAVRVARGLNRVLGRAGSVFADRYHCEVIKTPRQTRAALCYVMQNARRHGEHIDRRWNGIDPFSSAWWFDGWRHYDWQRGLRPPAQPPVAPARSWLLTIGWRRHGLLDLEEVPAARRHEDARRARELLRHARPA